jgi:hypothetical protein
MPIEGSRNDLTLTPRTGFGRKRTGRSARVPHCEPLSYTYEWRGKTVNDEFAWLENPGAKTHPALLDYITDELAYVN